MLIRYYKHVGYYFVVLLLGIGLALTYTACGGGGDGSAPPIVPGGDDLKGMELIEQDYQDQVIDYETYLIYKAQYIFGDSALPEKYQDQALTADGTTVFNEISTVFSTLSEECRQTLTPYLLRPDNPFSYIYQKTESWANAQMTTSSLQPAETGYRPGDLLPFKYIDTRDGYSRIWYLDFPDDPKNDEYKRQAQELAADLDGVNDGVNRTYMAYARFYNLLGKHPPSDIDLGGDERLDLYLTDSDVIDFRGWTRSDLGKFHGITIPDGLEKDARSSFSIIKTTTLDTRQDIRSTAVHEMFHMFQGSFDYFSFYEEKSKSWVNAWWTEATASFAEHLVYPDDDIERDYLEDFIEHPDWTLTSVKKDHEYGAYLFPFFLAKSFGENFYASIFKDNDGSPIIDTIENKLGSFDDAWKDFVLWNSIPNEHYGKTDSQDKLGEKDPFTYYQSYAGIEPNSWKTIQTPGKTTVDIPALKPLSAYIVRVQLNNVDFTHVSFTHLDDFNNQGTNTAIQALIYETAGFENPSGFEDWSGLSKQEYSLTQGNDRIQEFLLILSNASPKDKTTPSHLFIDTSIDTPISGECSINFSETRTWIQYDENGGLAQYQEYTFNMNGSLVGPGSYPEFLDVNPCLGLYQASWNWGVQSGTITFDLSLAYSHILYGSDDFFAVNNESGDDFYLFSGALDDFDENGATIRFPYTLISHFIFSPVTHVEFDQSPVYIEIVK